MARELVILGDGAEWIWRLVDEHFPHAVQILDWFHASEYLMPVAKAALATPVVQQQWLQQAKQALWDGDLDAVIDACLDLVRLAAQGARGGGVVAGRDLRLADLPHVLQQALRPLDALIVPRPTLCLLYTSRCV